MSRGPFLSPASAGEVLALIAAAKAHHPADPFGWILGYVTRAAEPVVQRELADVGGFDPRREPEASLAVPVGRVPLVRRPGS